MIPSLDRKLFDDFSVGIDDNRNMLMAFTYALGEQTQHEGGYLVFNPSTRELFVSKSDHSNTLLRRNLCSTRDFLQQRYTSEVLFDPENSDYLNYELTFDAYTQGRRVGEEFVWNINEIKCPGDCKELT